MQDLSVQPRSVPSPGTAAPNAPRAPGSQSSTSNQAPEHPEDLPGFDAVGRVGESLGIGAVEIDDIGCGIAGRFLQGIAKHMGGDELAIDPAAARIEFRPEGFLIGRALDQEPAVPGTDDVNFGDLPIPAIGAGIGIPDSGKPAQHRRIAARRVMDGETGGLRIIGQRIEPTSGDAGRQRLGCGRLATGKTCQQHAVAERQR